MKEIFLDAASNTALDKRVLKKMKPYLSEKFMGNSRSTHEFGIRASIAVEKARKLVAKICCTNPENVIFTSGATESNNMVIKGLALKEMGSKKAKKNQKRHIICSATEHDSVINACKQLEKLGFKVDYVKPKTEGTIRLEDVEPFFTENTLLICVMSVNNELGTMNDIGAITSFAKSKGVYSLVDCTQMVGYGGNSLELCSLYPNASFFSFSGHKIYGPTGTGCLIATDDNLKALEDNGLIVGGAQELGLRGGTTNVAGVVGISAALEIMYSYKMYLPLKYGSLYNYLENQLNKAFGGKCKINVVPKHKNIVSLNFGEYFDKLGAFAGYSLADILACHQVAVSAGSACDSQHDETEGDFNPSHVLMAIGLNEHDVQCTVRVSFNRKTRNKDIDTLIEKIKWIHEIAEGEDEDND